ncbi:hypothetical protein RhiirC2_751260 [Rhizophagus irregularis]|uniref:OTU domain-containing protein n=1 Tax=Rhizophagus irregularis TaxID=588596 RepID=A0A2N1N1P4_9GLOM|nr:hypothetical protein RhiirC2_751260 [Rhizophagus irregularis]
MDKSIKKFKFYLSPYVDVCISEGIVIIDEGACLLLPDEFNGYIYADTTADGNCLYNAKSLKKIIRIQIEHF